MNKVVEIGIIKANQGTATWVSPQRKRVYSIEGISPCLSTMQGGGLEPKVLVTYERKGNHL